MAMANPDRKTIGSGLSRGLRISLAADAGLFVVVVHVSMCLSGHGFHHGH
jgi:hypothetical protein